MKMGDKIGSIAEGKFADLVIFNGNTPSMVCAGVHDPVAAIILHSSPGDIDTVIIGGVVRKQNGKLLDIELDSVGQEVAGTGRLKWGDVARSLIKSRERIEAEASKMDTEAGERASLGMFGMSDDDLEDPW